MAVSVGSAPSLARARRITTSVVFAIVTLGAISMILPFVWMVLTSLKPDDEIFRQPITILPRVWDFANYKEAMETADFGRYFFNSSVVSISRMLSNLLLCSMAGYAFARLYFRGKDILFIVVLMTLMVPLQTILVPLFLIVRHMPLAGGNNLWGQGGIGLVNTYLGLIAPGAVGAFGIFLLRQFFLSLPRDLEDAARIDGCSEFGIYWRIILPLSKPALTTLAIFTFQASWNDFIWPLVVTQSDNMRVLQLGLQVFRQEFSTNWALLMAASVVTTLPVIVLFILGQRYFTQGIALTGMKG